MRRKRSKSPLAPSSASPHRTTRASSRSPRIPMGGILASPVNRTSSNSPKRGANGSLTSPPRSRQASLSPKKTSPNDEKSPNEINSGFRRSTRAQKGLNYKEEKELIEEGSDGEHSITESSYKSPQRESRKRAGYEWKSSPRSKRVRSDKTTNRDKSDESRGTTDEVSYPEWSLMHFAV